MQVMKRKAYSCVFFLHMASLASVTKFKALLNETSSARDSWYEALLTSASAVAEERCGRHFARATYTEYYNGNGRRTIWLHERPVQSITSVYVDHDGFYGQGGSGTTPYPASTLLVSGVDYALELDERGTHSRCGLLHRLRTVWPQTAREFYPGRITPQSGPAFGNIKVTYVAGYDPIPEDLQYAVCWIASFMKRTIAFGGNLESERIGDYSYTLWHPRFDNVPPELATADQILSRYKELAVGW